MLCEDKIIVLYFTRNNLLKELHHYEDQKVRVSDSEVVTTAFVPALYFGGRPDNVCRFMKLKGHVPERPGKSRFCRRLHRLSDLVLRLLFCLGKGLKDAAGQPLTDRTFFY